jgi:transcriptional regulator GlxA family with amidase domain
VARNLLEHRQDLPIGVIATLSGFTNASHFSRVFQAVHGRTPREHRAIGETGSKPFAPAPDET